MDYKIGDIVKIRKEFEQRISFFDEYNKILKIEYSVSRYDDHLMQYCPDMTDYEDIQQTVNPKLFRLNNKTKFKYAYNIILDNGKEFYPVFFINITGLRREKIRRVLCLK